MKIEEKGRIKQLFCKHDYQEGVLNTSTADPPIVLWNLNGDTYTTICIKCGKIKGTRFVRNFDGS